jgi:uncharacterized protein YbaR (Trm112 family)
MTSSATLDPDFLAQLACPACDDRPALRIDGGGQALVCTVCAREHPITRHGFPDLTVDSETPTRTDDDK